MANMEDAMSDEWRLYIGNKFSGYSVVPDAKYPGKMWRVRSPDGSLSDMVNLPRAKDAARMFAHPGGTEKTNWRYLQLSPEAR